MKTITKTETNINKFLNEVAGTASKVKYLSNPMIMHSYRFIIISIRVGEIQQNHYWKFEQILVNVAEKTKSVKLVNSY